MTRLHSIAWRRLQEVFDAAAEIDPAARGAFLDEQCAGDPLLRQQVDSLLLHYDADSGRLKAAVDGALDAASLTPRMVMVTWPETVLIHRRTGQSSGPTGALVQHALVLIPWGRAPVSHTAT